MQGGEGDGGGGEGEGGGVGTPQVLVAVSDKMKKDQPFTCLGKDQSFHLFGIPK